MWYGSGTEISSEARTPDLKTSVLPLHADMHSESDSSSTAATQDAGWLQWIDMGLGYHVPTMLVFHVWLTETDADGEVNRLPDSIVLVLEAKRTSSMVTL